MARGSGMGLTQWVGDARWEYSRLPAYLLTVEEDNPCPLGPPFFSKKSLRSDWSRIIGCEGLNGCSRP